MRKIIFVVAFLAICSMCLSPVQAVTEEEIEASIQMGLDWLASVQDLTPGPDHGSWPEFSNDQYGSQLARTAIAVKKFEHHALERGINPLDPAYEYYDQVKYGLNFIFSRAVSVNISATGQAGDPDSDSNGKGIYFSGTANGTNYETGISLMVISENNCPDSVVNVGNSDVDGRTYSAVAVDAMDYLAWGQNESSGRGGWRYTPNSGNSDQSVSGYATLGLAYAAAQAPHGFGLPLHSFVETELQVWVNNIQCHATGSKFGGSGYTSACDSYVKPLLTGNLLFEMALLGQFNGTNRDDAIQYLVDHWSPPWTRGYQELYCVMKGLEFQEVPDILPNSAIDWYDDLATFIVNTQNTTPGPAYGSWPKGMDYTDEVMTTAWALLTLERAAPPGIQSVFFDIKPQSCPNPLNTKRNLVYIWESDETTYEVLFKGTNPMYPQKIKAVLPAAILGTEDFDVTNVDPTTVMLAGVPADRWNIEDVSVPVGFEADSCECTTEGPDGFDDLTLKFELNAIIAALGPVQNGDVIPLMVTGMLYDSTEFEGYDCVLIRARDDAETGGDDPLINLSGVNLSNSPNPFNTSTVISFTLPTAGNVQLEIYDVLGRKVRRLVDDHFSAGQHTVGWNGKDDRGNPVGSGLYFYRLTTLDRSMSRKMILMK